MALLAKNGKNHLFVSLVLWNMPLIGRKFYTQWLLRRNYLNPMQTYEKYRFRPNSVVVSNWNWLLWVRESLGKYSWLLVVQGYFCFKVNLKLNSSECDSPRASANARTVEIVGFATPRSILLNWEYSMSACRANSLIFKYTELVSTLID